MAAKMTPLEAYQHLYPAFGPQNWWPAESAFEVCVGAILTQNTAWANVEKAITNLKKHDLMTEKAERLKDFAVYVVENYGGVQRMLSQPTGMLRRELLSLKGIGPETADSMLLYAAGKPVFVVDAYTKRIGSRMGWFEEKALYHEVQDFFYTHLDKNAKLYNEFHALLVRLAKENCRKKPVCGGCPLAKDCKKRLLY